MTHAPITETNQNKTAHSANTWEATFHIKIHLKPPSNMKTGRHPTKIFLEINFPDLEEKNWKIKPHYSYLICYCLASTVLRAFIINLFTVFA